MIYAPFCFKDSATALEYAKTLEIPFKIVFDSDGYQVIVEDSDINKDRFRGF